MKLHETRPQFQEDYQGNTDGQSEERLRETKPTVVFEPDSEKPSIKHFTVELEGVKRAGGEIQLDDEGPATIIWFGLDNREDKGMGYGKVCYQALIDQMIETWPSLPSIEATTFIPQMLRIVIGTKLPQGWHKKYYLDTELEYGRLDGGKLVDAPTALGELENLNSETRAVEHIFELQQ